MDTGTPEVFDAMQGDLAKTTCMYGTSCSYFKRVSLHVLIRDRLYTQMYDNGTDTLLHLSW
jgi:hypothetical protein